MGFEPMCQTAKLLSPSPGRGALEVASGPLCQARPDKARFVSCGQMDTGPCQPGWAFHYLLATGKTGAASLRESHLRV